MKGGLQLLHNHHLSQTGQAVGMERCNQCTWVLLGAACLCRRLLRQPTCHVTPCAGVADLAPTCLMAAVGLQRLADVLSHVSFMPVSKVAC